MIDDLAKALHARIEDRSAVVAVIGLGYVGLPLVELFADRGFRVLGFDIDPAKVETLRAGGSYIGHIDSSRIRSMIDSGRFEATADFGRLGEPDAILICVPTPLGEHREPDLGPVENTGKAIAPLAAPRSARDPGEHDLPRDHPRRPPPRAGDRARDPRRDAITSWPTAPSARTPATPSIRPGRIPKVVGGCGRA